MGMLDLTREGKFTIVTEFTPHSAEEVKHIAEVAKGLAELNAKYAPHNIAFAGVSITQNPGGQLSYDHQGVLAILKEEGFPETLEVLPHVTGKDMNTDGVRTLLTSLAERGVRTVLALTGDEPIVAKGVFEIDSLGMLQVINEVNIDMLRKKGRSAEAFAEVNLLTPGAAVSPFKYTEGALAMQYIKAAKKVHEGAYYLTLQSGWDADRCEHLMQHIGDLGVPILGNVLVVGHAAAKYMQTLPGCVVTDDFLARLSAEQPEDNMRRASQQMAMFRDLGYAGIDLGKPAEFKDVAEIEKIVDDALEIKNWREFKDNLVFAPPVSPAPKFRRSAAFSKKFHDLTFEPDGALHGIAKAVLTPFEKSVEKEGALYRLFNAIEVAGKGVLYECHACGDCFLPENDFVCTYGGCEKGLANPPCGDADPRGMCGNNENRVCAGEMIYYRMLHHNELERFKKITLPPRNPELEDTPSILNYFFGRDHTTHKNPLEGSGLIQVGEMLHATIPLPGAAMKYIQKLGPDGFTTPNRGLLMVRDIIEEQALEGASYLDINVDELTVETPEAMRNYVKLVHRFGRGVPACIDSSNIEVLVAGLETWFGLEGVKPPLMNSVTFVDKDKYGPIYDLRKKHDFSTICLLVGPEGPLQSADAMYDAAKEMFGILTGAGFRPEQIYYDTVTLGIGTDGCMDPMGMIKASHTHNSFNAIKRIRQDPQMRGVHALLGVSNWVYGARKRRIGHVRAFVEVAKRHGLDAAIIDTSKQFGVQPYADELVGFVDMFVGLDGSEDSMMTYSMKMQEAREAGWV